MMFDRVWFYGNIGDGSLLALIKVHPCLPIHFTQVGLFNSLRVGFGTGNSEEFKPPAGEQVPERSIQ